ncbi:unnamed protein product [Durusdinium trenchii]|uniref:Uncharacterized protein n=2 Tax=Durusdinium trenchii TaxID=1381693 RepID=A0ABP0QFW0_9DINO
MAVAFWAAFRVRLPVRLFARHTAAGMFGKPDEMAPKRVVRSKAPMQGRQTVLGRPSVPMPGVAPHLQALQRLSEMLPPLGGGGFSSSWRARQERLRANNDQRQQEDVFNESKKFLMESDIWTFGNMLAYQRKLLDLLGANSWRRRLSADDPNIQYLEKELRVLEAMTPVELASNHKSVFNSRSIALIAEKSNTTVKFVNQVILEHDVLRADRRWYQILAQFDRPQPKSFEDRSFMAEYDRPFSQSEDDMREEMIEKQQRIQSKKKSKRLTWIWYRHPSCGGNRWSTRPPRWYPAQWKTRPERRLRLAGVGVPGGGGDRGRPWGRLAAWVGDG